MWELDVQLTADLVPIVVHDKTLERTSDVISRPEFIDRAPWLVQDFSLEEIKSLDFGSWFRSQDPFFQIAQGSVTMDDLSSYAGLRAPTLAEALAFTRDNGIRVNIEIKDLAGRPGHEYVTAKVLETVGVMGLLDAVLFSSFNFEYMRDLKSVCPSAATAIIVEERPDPLLEILKDLGVQAYHPRLDLLTPEEVLELTAAGFQVNVWTVNAEADMAKFLEAGVSGIITDFPQVLTNLFKEAGQ